MDDNAFRILRTALLLSCSTVLFFMLSAVMMRADEGGYFLIPEEITNSYFPVSDGYMIPEDENTSQIVQRAKSYEELKNYRQAARYYGFAYNRAPDSKAAPFIRFKQSFLTERSAEVIELLLGILERHPDFPYADAVRFELARRYFLQQEYDRSEQLLRQILENEEQGIGIFTPYVHAFIGILRQTEGRYEDAESFHEDAIELLASMNDGGKAPYIVRNYLEISRCLLSRNEYERAEDLLKRIIGTAQNPLVRQEAYVLLAESGSKSGNVGISMSAYRELSDKFPDSIYRGKAKKRMAELGQPAPGQAPEGKLGYYDPSVTSGTYLYGKEYEKPPIEGKFSIQIGSFSIEANAQKLVGILEEGGYGAFIVETALEQKQLFRVRVGGYVSVEEAQAAKSKLESMGYSGFIVNER
jgi:tetratricopeptide (TPR) repeat protein